ncbi:MAG TPA: heme ABC exporter ATP-binding protein CcmA [Acidobacteriota bacterium]|nr:heme ABC exporter ATP-binding protein CcmA [Acidobacteriota bacterium]
MQTQQNFAPDLALQIEFQRFKIGLTTILRDIHFELKRGEVLAILGPNGAGKSTILKLIAGLFKVEGKCIILGSEKRTEATRRQIGYLGHETFLYDKLTARENLEFFAELYGSRVSIDSLLSSFQLEDVKNQLVQAFSRGMKQRLALTRAMLASPELLLLDEPFTGLDINASVLLEAIVTEQRNKTAIVLTTHELPRAYEIADRFLILKNGKQIFSGDRSEISSGIEEFYRKLTA